MRRKLIIAVDGPAGSGKSSTFKEIANRLGYNFIDTGLMYRALTLLALQSEVDFDNPKALIALMAKFDYQVINNQVFLNNKNVSSQLNDQKILNKINKITSIPQIRKKMVALQRNFAKLNINQGVIVVGRDITSVVLPKADLKIYLDSSIERRALRRLEQNDQQLKDLSKLKLQIKNRDFEDQHRKFGALKRTKDA